MDETMMEILKDDTMKEFAVTLHNMIADRDLLNRFMDTTAMEPEEMGKYLCSLGCKQLDEKQLEFLHVFGAELRKVFGKA